MQVSSHLVDFFHKLSAMDSLEQRQIVNAVHVASAVVLIYDLILTLHLEISFVWFSKWNYTKVLYFVTRYTPIAANALIIYSYMVGSSSVKVCSNTVTASGWLYLLGLNFAEVILVVRTWACWGRNKWVGIGLGLWTLLCQITSAVFMYKFLGSIKLSPPPLWEPSLSGCFIVSSNRLLWVDWLAFLLGEGVTLVLMAIFAYRTFREGYNLPFVKLLYRDGLIFYVYLFCLTATNIALVVALDIPFVAMMSPVQSAIHSVLTARIILNIREMASRRLDDYSFDLHLSDADTHASGISFSENMVAFHPDDRQEGDTIGQWHRHGHGAGVLRVEMVSSPSHTIISHVTLPMTRDVWGNMVVGQTEPDYDDEKDSIYSSPEDCV